MVLARFLGGAALMVVSAPPVLASSAKHYGRMGPLRVDWPPDRGWGEDEGQNAPCGSSDGAGERTEFPLSGGSLALGQKDVAYDLEVYISLSEDPQSSDDFELISNAIPSLNFSHVCIDSPDLLDVASPPKSATLQFRYLAADRPHPHKRPTGVNETFYICSDVTLVLPELFTHDIPCFNASATERGGRRFGLGHPPGGSSGGGVSKTTLGAVIGVVIGCAAGLAFFVATMWFWRRRVRAAAAAREAREADIARQVAEADAKLRGLETPPRVSMSSGW